MWERDRCGHTDFTVGLVILQSQGPRYRGGAGEPWPPQKFSVVAAVNLYSFTILAFQNMFLSFSRSFSTFH